MPRINDSVSTAPRAESQTPSTISFRLNVNGQELAVLRLIPVPPFWTLYATISI